MQGSRPNSKPSYISSSSDSESEVSESERNPFKYITNLVGKTSRLVGKTSRRLRENPDDQQVQDREDAKYTGTHRDLHNFKALTTKGQSELDQRGMYQSLLQKTKTNGNTVYDNMLNDQITYPKFKLVRNFLGLNFLKNIYLIVAIVAGKEVRIPVGAYLIESVIQNGDDRKSFFSIKDIALFPYEMIHDKLVAMPTYARTVLNLNEMNFGIIKEIAKNFKYTIEEDTNGNLTRNLHWDENIAKRLSREAILDNLKRIVREEIKKDLTPDEEHSVKLYKYNLEINTKENLKVLGTQGSLSAPNVMHLLSQFSFGSNVTNREDFVDKIHTLGKRKNDVGGSLRHTKRKLKNKKTKKCRYKK